MLFSFSFEIILSYFIVKIKKRFTTSLTIINFCMTKRLSKNMPKTPKYLFLRAWSQFIWSRPAILEWPHCFRIFKRKIRNSWLRNPPIRRCRQRDVTLFKVGPPFWISYFVFANFNPKFGISDPENNTLQIFKLFHK